MSALVALMVAISLLATITLGWFLYHDTVKEQRWWLENLVREQASLIAAAGRVHLAHTGEDPSSGSWDSSMIQIYGARQGSGEFGETGEIVLGRRDGDEIVFLRGLRHWKGANTQRVALHSGAAEPMRRALQGESGSLIGLDYRGVKVLAAYQPLPDMHLGIVAKIDLDEVRGPLIRQTAIGGFGALLVITIGALLALRLSTPLIRHLEAALQDLEEAQHIAGAGSWRWHIPTGREVWSDEQFRIFGYRPGEIEPSYASFLHAVHPEDRTLVEAAVGQALDARRPYEAEFRIVRPDGSLRHIYAQGIVCPDDDGQPLSMAGTLLDITRSKRMEQTLAQERERAEEFLRISQAMILALDTEGRVTLINRRGCEILGYREEEIVGRDWFGTLVAEGLRAELEEHYRAMVRGLVPLQTDSEYGVLTRSGELRHIAWHNTLRRDASGAVVGCLNSGVDVTSLKRAEEESRHLASHDVLTGLPNRALFRDRIERALTQAQRDSNLVGLLYLDLDDFKPVNDSLGHATGDALLKVVSDRLRRTLREVDTVARVGGDEFTVILGGAADRAVVAAMVRKITDSLARPYSVCGRELCVKASIGTAIYPLDASTAEQLLARADSAMYENKRRHNGALARDKGDTMKTETAPT